MFSSLRDKSYQCEVIFCTSLHCQYFNIITPIRLLIGEDCGQVSFIEFQNASSFMDYW